MHDWQDVRVFLAAARERTLAAAGERLGVDAATIGRRVSRLETALKATLFARSARGLALTAAGARLLEAALEAEAAMEAAAGVGAAAAAGGTLRLSVAEGFGTAIVAPALPAFRAAHPSLRIELVAEAGFLSAQRREVDAAVTLSAPPEGRLVAEPLTEYDLGLYAAEVWLREHGPVRTLADLKDEATVGYVEDLIYAPELQYLRDLGAHLRPALTSSSIRAQEAMVRAGGGVGVLPCFLAGAGLSRILPETVSLRRRFWLGVHRDVAATARGRALRAWLLRLVAEHRALLTPPAFPPPERTAGPARQISGGPS